MPEKNNKYKYFQNIRFWQILASVLLILLLLQIFYQDKEIKIIDKQERYSTSALSKTQKQNISNETIKGIYVNDDENIRLVTKVIDGDTIVLENGKVVRYIGIDTPEVSQGKECFSREATEKNKQLVLGKKVELRKDISETDRYGRLLRYVYQDGKFINEILVREGFANALTYPPDVSYSELFLEAQNEAREEMRGLWDVCDKSVNIAPTVEEKYETRRTVNPLDNSNINCSINSYNCADFTTQLEAQNVFETCGGSANDIHKLDRDDDGKVCETLP